MDKDIASPCTNACAMDETRGLCRGCWRTLEEIVHWTDYSSVEKLLVIKRTAERNTTASDMH